MKIVFATQNRGKLREAAEILGDGVEILTPEDCGVEGEAEETGTTFAENSLLKAKYVSDRVFGNMEDGRGTLKTSPGESANASGDMGNDAAEDVVAVFADDSGLETDALGGEPGIYTARYAGDDKNFTDNMDKLLTKLAEAGAETPSERSVRFRCTVTLIFRNGGTTQYEGFLEGHIAASRAGQGGFGYDPVFIPSDSELSSLASAGLSEQEIAGLRGKTLAEIPEHLKNLISHRYKALLPVREMMRSVSVVSSL